VLCKPLLRGGGRQAALQVAAQPLHGVVDRQVAVIPRGKRFIFFGCRLLPRTPLSTLVDHDAGHEAEDREDAQPVQPLMLRQRRLDVPPEVTPLVNGEGVALRLLRDALERIAPMAGAVVFVGLKRRTASAQQADDQDSENLQIQHDRDIRCTPRGRVPGSLNHRRPVPETLI